MAQYRSFRSIGARLWVNIVQGTAGGSWANQLPEAIQRNLRWFYSDGLFSAASDTITITYLTLYVLSLGATRADIGFMTAILSLVAAIVLLPGAILAEKSKSRKRIVLLSGGLATRTTLILMAIVPFFFSGQVAVGCVIALKVIGDACVNLGFPAWTSLTADIVPMAWRGRYFGARNITMSVIAMGVTFGIGALITRFGSPGGYQIALGIAFLLGMASTFSYWRIKEPMLEGAIAPPQTYTPAALWQTIRGDPNFTAFLIYTMVWNFALNVAGPFFTVYQVQVLKASATMVGFISIASSLAGIPAMRFFGPLADRWGARRLLLLTGFLIPIMPFFWAFTTQLWQPVLLNIAGGVLWAGYGLASFNFLLGVSSAHQRARYTAMTQISVAIGSALGAVTGGQIATHWGYPAIFFVSAAGRMIASLYFARYVKENK